MRIAFASMDLNTGSSSPGELEMTRRTSEVAFCCSSASSSSRLSRVTVVCGSAAEGRRTHDSTVSPRHCEIIYDHRTHMLCNRGREGTLVNDCLATQAVPLRGGDWIRLGPDGPLLRFLGHSTDLRTTA